MNQALKRRGDEPPLSLRLRLLSLRRASSRRCFSPEFRLPPTGPLGLRVSGAVAPSAPALGRILPIGLSVIIDRAAGLASGNVVIEQIFVAMLAVAARMLCNVGGTSYLIA